MNQPGSDPACDPDDIAIKSFFLGPRAENEEMVRHAFEHILSKWITWRRSLYPQDGSAVSKENQKLEEFKSARQCGFDALEELVARFEREIPKFTPRYIGHMFSEISLPALYGHLAALIHNPNNISGESSVVGTQIEQEAISELCKMIGFDPNSSTGHFVSGGTVANFEFIARAKARLAAWLAAGAVSSGARFSLSEAAHMGWDRYQNAIKRIEVQGKRDELKKYDFVQSNPWKAAKLLAATYGTEFEGPVLLVPQNKHYSWPKGVSVMGLGEESFWPVALDHTGRMCVEALREKIETAMRQNRPILGIVAVAGTTELGLFDPINEIVQLVEEYRARGIHLWLHIDAAFGAYFRTLPSKSLSKKMSAALEGITHAASVTLDPHKLGYVPYSSGVFLAKDKKDYQIINIDAPYVAFDRQSDKGPFTLEGSRGATGAAATWMTARATGLNENGYGRILGKTYESIGQVRKMLADSDLGTLLVPEYDTNVTCFTFLGESGKLSESNALALKIFDAFTTNQNGEFFVSKTKLTSHSQPAFFNELIRLWNVTPDVDSINLIRICIMNPFFTSREMKTDFAAEFISALRRVL